MADWLVRDVTAFGIASGQHGMLIALALIAIGIIMTWQIDR
jgi:lipoprotein signal peptidase